MVQLTSCDVTKIRRLRWWRDKSLLICLNMCVCLHYYCCCCCDCVTWVMGCRWREKARGSFRSPHSGPNPRQLLASSPKIQHWFFFVLTSWLRNDQKLWSFPLLAPSTVYPPHPHHKHVRHYLTFHYVLIKRLGYAQILCNQQDGG